MVLDQSPAFRTESSEAWLEHAAEAADPRTLCAWKAEIEMPAEVIASLIRGQRGDPGTRVPVRERDVPLAKGYPITFHTENEPKKACKRCKTAPEVKGLSRPQVDLGLGQKA